MNSDISDERYQGTVKGYSAKDSYGFIANPELRAKYNADVYLHKNVYEQVRPPLEDGETVEFSVHINDKNKPQACFVNRVRGGSGRGGGYGGAFGGKGAGGRANGGWGNPPW